MTPGDVVAERFELEALAGLGNLGVVYRARDRLTGELVALKRPALLDPADVARFVREARMLAELRHDAVVRHVAHGVTEAGAPWIAMAWLEGETLAARLARGTLTVAEALAVVRRAALGLGAAHVRGIVHRDIKPANVFLPGGAPEAAVMLDFGVARWAAATALTRPGTTVGTIGYMSPEQARGAVDVDARADVFALGCVLYECLTGRRPFGDDAPVAVFLRAALGEIPRLAAVRPELPAALDELLARLLARDPAARPVDGHAIAAALDALPALEPSAHDAPPPRPALTTGEQRVLSIVLVCAAPGGRVGGDTPTVTPASRTVVRDRLRAVAAGWNAQLESLADGSAVLTVSGTDAATDQAARAAGCAQAACAAVPEAVVLLATGRGEVSGTSPVGEVVERAATLLTGDPPRAPGVVWLDDVSAGLLEPRFELARDAHGRASVRAPRAAAGGPRVLLGRALPLFGREREMAQLEAVWRECVGESVARAAVVVGEPGSGKSRLMLEFVARLSEGAAAPPAGWMATGTPAGAGAAFGMLGRLVRAAAGIVDDDAPATRRARLAECVARSVAPDDQALVLDVLGELAGASPEDSSPVVRAARHDARIHGDQIRAAWQALVHGAAAAGPLLLVLDDLHWGDAPSVVALDAALDRAGEAPVMALALGRAELPERFPRLWASRGAQSFALGGLTPRAAARMVRHGLGAVAPEPLVARVVEQCAGNPFYCEELIRAVADGREEFPGTVLAMVQSRLAAIEPPARRILRAASVFGVEFPRDGVGALVGAAAGSGADREPGTTQPSSAVRAAIALDVWLAELVARELISADPRGAGARWSFRHGLVREAAYATLTDADRALGHRLAGAWLEAHDPTADAGVLADHYDRGGERAIAAPWFVRAARRSATGLDLAAAREYVRRGLAAAPDDGAVQIALRVEELHAVLIGGALDEANPLGDALLAELPPGTDRWYAVLGRLLSANLSGGDAARIGGLIAVLYQQGPAREPDALRAEAWAVATHLLVTAGHRAVAADLLAWNKPPADPSANPAHTAWASVAQAVGAMGEGEPWRMLACAEHGVAGFRAVGDERSGLYALNLVIVAAIYLGAFERAAAALAHAETAARRGGGSLADAWLQAYRGRIAAGRGARADAIRELTDAADSARARGHAYAAAVARGFLAEVLRAAGDASGAEGAAREATDALGASPRMRAWSTAVHARALAALGRGDDAVARAREAWAAHDALGGASEFEVTFRLARIESAAAAGDRAGAALAAHDARAWLRTRAELIADPALRASFLERVPENRDVHAHAAAFDP